jgi:LysM repeat protein
MGAMTKRKVRRRVISPLPPGTPTPGNRPVNRRPRQGAVPGHPAGHGRPVVERRPQPKRRGFDRDALMWWGVVTPAIALPLVIGVTVLVLALSIAVFYGGKVFPRVSAAGVPLGGLTPDQAAQVLTEQWATLLLRDGERTWAVDPARLGIELDAVATANQAFEQGRGQGGMLAGLLSAAEVTPVIRVDAAQARSTLLELSPQFELSAVNAGVELVAGQVTATPPRAGRSLLVIATLNRLQDTASLADGVLDLVMEDVAPLVVDVSTMVSEAERLLNQPLDIVVHDPVTGDRVTWSAPPEEWARWLTAEADTGQPTGLVLSVNPDAVTAYLQRQADAILDPSRYLNPEEVVVTIRESLAAGEPAGVARVYHHDRQHVVSAGESLISIAWDYGVPYPWLQQANPGLGSLAVGQTITIPSPDNFLEFPVVWDKRVVISISQQHAWVYENGDLRWDWTISTGIADSPTWPGIYQIISHVPNAYAANWNLYMPYFMGVYRPIPGADFTNGFHGFPTRGGSQLLWTNSLGTRVTYGCILLSNQNAEALYNWAENGVVVEIQA